MSDIKIKVVAFGIARDIIGGRSLEICLQEGATVSEAMTILKQKFPAFEQLSSLNLAINEEYVNDGHEIQADDELVLIPPVSGG